MVQCSRNLPHSWSPGLVSTGGLADVNENSTTGFGGTPFTHYEGQWVLNRYHGDGWLQTEK
jgi:hypothetical protein